MPGRQLQPEGSHHADEEDDYEMTTVEWTAPSTIKSHDSGPGQNAIEALQAAATAAQDFNEYFSHIRNDDKEAGVPLFLGDELVMGSEPLRHWGYYDEFELKAVRTRPDLMQDAEESDEGQELKREATVQATTENCYSIKIMQPGLIDLDYGVWAAEDLMTETRLLMNLGTHPHMAQIYGLNRGGIDTLLESGRYGFFIITDRIKETLPDRILTWKAKQGYRPPREPGQVVRRFAQRLEVAVDIASALKFLHEHKLVYHIRPDKIGFDARDGTVKLFQFGQVRPDGCVQAPSLTKAEDMNILRYTAPEVLCKAPATTSSDIYSFAVVLWEIMSLKVPYGNCDRPTHMERCVQSHHRPPMNRQWPTACHDILQGMWHPHLRLTMRKVHVKLLDLLKIEEAGGASSHDVKVSSTHGNESHQRQAASHRKKDESAAPSQDDSPKEKAEMTTSNRKVSFGSEQGNASIPPTPRSSNGSTLLNMLKENGLSVDENGAKAKRVDNPKPKSRKDTSTKESMELAPSSASNDLSPPSQHGNEIHEDSVTSKKEVASEVSAESMGYEMTAAVQDTPPRSNKSHRRAQRRSSVDVSCRVTSETPVALQFMTPQPLRGRIHRSASMSHVPTSDNNVVAMVLPSVPLDVDSPKKLDIDEEYQEGEEGQAMTSKPEKMSDRVRGFIKNLGRSKKKAEENKEEDQRPISETSINAPSSADTDGKHPHNTEEGKPTEILEESRQVNSPHSDGNASSANEEAHTAKSESSHRERHSTKKKKSRKPKSGDDSPPESREAISWSRVTPRSPRRASMGRMVSKRIISGAPNHSVEPISTKTDAPESPKASEVITWQRGGHRSPRRASMSRLQGTRSSLVEKEESEGLQKPVADSQPNERHETNTSSHLVSPTRRRRVVSGTIRRQSPAKENESDTRQPPEVPQTPGRMRMRRRLSTGAMGPGSDELGGGQPASTQRPQVASRHMSVPIGPASEEWRKDDRKSTHSSAYDSDRIEQLINLEEEDSKDDTPVEPQTPHKRFSKTFAIVAQKFWKGKEGDKERDGGQEADKQKTPGVRARRASVC